jgi:hypothetical protein
MRKKLICVMAYVFLTVKLGLLSSLSIAQSGDELAILVPGGGDYSRSIGSDSEMAQQFFDQGLRMAWGFYFPESIASYQEASRLDPQNPMPYWGIAHAAGPNPNSRYVNLPDDPQGAGLAAIRKALDLANNGTQLERDLISATFVLYNKDAIPDNRERDFAFLDAMRSLHDQYPEDADIAKVFGEA